MPDLPSRTLEVVDRDGSSPLRLTLRSLTSADDYARCEALQEATWGAGFNEIASATMMMISQKVGGVAAGAFDDDGELRGLIFGISGMRDGRPAHWSHVMAVDTALHGRGIGRHLKAYQRQLLLDIGIDVMYWTYDPLVARNAHLNLERLAAEPVEYARDLYGDGSHNLQHRGLGTDRFIVRWEMRDDQVERRLAARPPAPTDAATPPPVNSDNGSPKDPGFQLPDAHIIRIEIPHDIQTLKNEHPELARRWRLSTRHAFLGYMQQGYRVRGFQRLDQRCFYRLHGP